jgi:hypothetical protein
MSVSNFQGENGEISLRRWRVIEIEMQDGVRSRHVCGHDVDKNTGRASTTITQFNQDTMVATTQSGSAYRLVGLPGNSRLGKSAWAELCKERGAVSEYDVTHEYLDASNISTVGFERFKRTLIAQSN